MAGREDLRQADTETMSDRFLVAGKVDVEALALERYPGESQGPERAAFIDGFLQADPGRASRDPGRHRHHWGDRSAVFRRLNVDDSVTVPLVDGRNWNTWRSLAVHFNRTYGCRIRVFRQGNDLLITREL